MPNFKYQGRNSNGKLVTGVRSSESIDLLSSELFKEGITPIKISPLSEKRKFSLNLQFSFGKKRVSSAELALFTRQMYTLIRSGVPVIAAIKHLAESCRTHYFASVLDGLATQLESGKNLAAAMQNYPNAFSPLMIGMVQVGQSSGRLDESFSNLTRYLELESSTLKRIKTAIRYPIFVICAIIAAVIIIMIFVIPTFAKVYAKANIELPLFTIYLIKLTTFITEYWFIFLGIVLLIIIAVRDYLKTKEGRFKWDRYKLRLPVVGILIRRIILLRFTQTFAIVMNAGIPIIEGLSLVAISVENAYAYDEVINMQKAIQEGKGIVQAASLCKLFTPLEVQMLAISEQTGELGTVLSDISQYYQREVEYDLKRLTDLIEPIILAAMAVLVLLLALSVYLPIWNMVKLIRH